MNWGEPPRGLVVNALVPKLEGGLVNWPGPRPPGTGGFREEKDPPLEKGFSFLPPRKVILAPCFYHWGP